MTAGAPRSKLKATLLGLPIFVKMMALSSGITLLLGAGLFWQFRLVWHQDELQELEEKGRFHAKTLAARVGPFLHRGDLEGVRRMLKEVVGVPSEINSAQVRDGKGRLLAEAGPVDRTARVREVTVPIGNGLDGRIRLTMDEAGVAREMVSLALRLASMIVIIAVIGIVAVWWLARWFTRPVRELVESTRRVKHGDYQTRTPVLSADEVGELAARFNEMTDALEQKEAARRHLMRKVIGAAEDERKRVARELHDQTGQALVSLISGLAALESQADSEELAQLKALAALTLSEVHDIALALRPSALDDLGLEAALQSLCQRRARGLDVKVNFAAVGLDANCRLPSEIELALYRICQEALTNALRHGRARLIEVLVQRNRASMLIVIEDDGCGFQAQDWREHCRRGDHLGLLGMEERAILLGGTLRVESRPGGGTSLFVEIPLLEKGHA